MTQKEFVIGLIENEIERNLTKRAAESEQQEASAAKVFEGSFGNESKGLDEEPDEAEDQGMAMWM